MGKTDQKESEVKEKEEREEAGRVQEIEEADNRNFQKASPRESIFFGREKLCLTRDECVEKTCRKHVGNFFARLNSKIKKRNC